MPLSTRRRVPPAEFRLPVIAPYRLDLTANVLRRLSTNVVDVLGADGVFRRLLTTDSGPLIVEVAQPSSDALRVAASGARTAQELAPDLVRRMLGTEVDLAMFYRASASVRWLAPLVERMRGVRPPRYPTLWEACVNAIVFQQVSIFAAGAIMRRLIEELGEAFDLEGRVLYAFPPPEAIAAAAPARLRSVGLSAAKASTLVGIAEALRAGTLDETRLEGSSSVDAAGALTKLKGIGPWTAAVILLRGLGRLDVFPENDSGAARSLAFVTKQKPAATARVLQKLGSQRGMLYYHLLLARLEARGELPAPH
jgi:DNA-3-methyladenine glycosylase II